MNIPEALLERFPSISPQLFKTSTEVSIQGETGVSASKCLVLENEEQILVEFPANLLEANGLEIMPGNRLVLTPVLYRHWFRGKREQQWKESSKRLLDNFIRAWERRDLVLSRPEYFMIRTPWLVSGMVYMVASAYPLGALFESWESGQALKVRGKNQFIRSVKGSSMSGSHIHTAWDPEQGIFVNGQIAHGVNNWRDYVQAFVDLGQKYPIRLGSDLTWINRLLAELEIP